MAKSKQNGKQPGKNSAKFLQTSKNAKNQFTRLRNNRGTLHRRHK